MTIYYCEHEWEAMLTCIYEANASHKGQQNIRLCFGPIEQYNLFDEFIEVQADSEKAQKVVDAVNIRISQYFYSRIAYLAMAQEEDVLDLIYRLLLLGFNYGESVLEMMQYDVVTRANAVYKRYSSEVHHFREFIRFCQAPGDTYIALIEPKSHVVVPLGECFKDRMPSENFMIADTVHSEAIVHMADRECFLKILTNEELQRIIEIEKHADKYTDLWKIFFDSIAIKERKNEKCQNNLFPKWMRQHATEFMR